jgi:hypothetical protein
VNLLFFVFFVEGFLLLPGFWMDSARLGLLPNTVKPHEHVVHEQSRGVRIDSALRPFWSYTLCVMCLNRLRAPSAVAVLLFALTSAASAQTAVGAISVGVPVIAPNIFTGPTGKPYSGEQVSEHSQTLADGTNIVQTLGRVVTYRDSEGRIRNERYFVPPMQGVVVPPPNIEIIDPVAHYHYMLDQRNHVARRMVWPPSVRRGSTAPPSQSATATAWFFPGPSTTGSFSTTQTNTTGQSPTISKAMSDRPHPEHNRESLGTQIMEGLTVEGTRTTTTYPAGLMGNDRPITTVMETWVSPDLKVTVLSKNSDPRNGEQTTKLINISQSEPDPSLFQVPADYTVTDQN